MKKLTWLCLTAISANALAQSDQDIAAKMTKITSRAMYLNNHCNVSIDKEKYKEVAKLIAFSEGMDIKSERIEWEKLILPARSMYQELAQKYPNGERCEVLLERAEGILPMIKNHSAMDLDTGK